MASTYKQFCERWKNGCGSSLCSRATRIVLARGSLPCNLLFIGEAPGVSEDVIGLPFVGKAGKLLDWIIAQALKSWQMPGTEGPRYNQVRWAFCNLVGCIPRPENSKKKTEEPDAEDIIKCRPRLEQFIEVANPRGIIAVGKLAEDWLQPGMKNNVRVPEHIAVEAITHPAFIIRQPEAAQSLLRKRCIIAIRSMAESFGFTSSGEE